MKEEEFRQERAQRREELFREVFGSTEKRETREEKAPLLMEALLKRRRKKYVPKH